MTEETSLRNVDFNMSKHFTLSIRLGYDRFAFSIYNPLNEQPLSYIVRDIDKNMSLPANIKQALRDNSFLNHPFFRVNVVIDAKRYSTVPFEIFEDEATETLYYNNFPQREDDADEIMYNILPKANTVVLFGIDKHIEQLLADEYSNLRFFAHTSPLLEYFANKSCAGNSKKLYAYIKQDTIDIFCFDHSNLLLVNTFMCKSTADILYYILYVWKQLGYSQESDELHIAGNTDDKDHLISRLQQFVKQLFFVTPESELGTIENIDLKEIPFDLLTLNLCEL